MTTSEPHRRRRPQQRRRRPPRRRWPPQRPGQQPSLPTERGEAVDLPLMIPLIMWCCLFSYVCSHGQTFKTVEVF
jgi:hypothetical protein